MKPVMFQMLQTVGQFHGLSSEDPHLHLKSFLGVSDSFVIQGVPRDALRLTLFPYSLRDGAKSWLNSFAPGSIRTWDELAENFLSKYFPPNRNAKLRSEIVGFRQLEDETFSEAWERFKELLRKCPHHGLPHCIQMETFYNGLNGVTQGMVDASAGGALLAKTFDEAYEILERISINSCQWSDVRGTKKKVKSVLEVDGVSTIRADLAMIANALKNVTVISHQQPPAMEPTAVVNQVTDEACVYCGEDHNYEFCPSNPASVFFVGN